MIREILNPMLTQLINARILTPQGWLKDGSVLIRDGKILEVTNCDLAVIGAQLIDVKGMYVLPGGVEIHAHGGGGRDFMECTEDAFRGAVQTHMKYGTTSIFPTLSSSTVPMIEQAAETCTKMMAEKDSPILGLHLEGHYLNMAMAGGQMPENIKNPDPNEYIPIVENWHCIKRWDAAPELPGAMQFGKYITGKGILASVAHTQAEFEDIRTAYEAGYTHATHFYNAMPGFHKRREYKYEGTVESIYLMDDMTVEVVADGIHVPPTILRLVYKIKGVERMCAITDALACAASDSKEAFDPRVIIEDGVCKLADHSALAGSVATMDRLIRTMVQKAIIYDRIISSDAWDALMENEYYYNIHRGLLNGFPGTVLALLNIMFGLWALAASVSCSGNRPAAAPSAVGVWADRDCELLRTERFALLFESNGDTTTSLLQRMDATDTVLLGKTVFTPDSVLMQYVHRPGEARQYADPGAVQPDGRLRIVVEGRERMLEKIESFAVSAPYEMLKASPLEIGFCIQQWSLGTRCRCENGSISFEAGTNRHSYTFNIEPGFVYCRAARLRFNERGGLFAQNIRMMANAREHTAFRRSPQTSDRTTIIFPAM